MVNKSLDFDHFGFIPQKEHYEIGLIIEGVVQGVALSSLKLFIGIQKLAIYCWMIVRTAKYQILAWDNESRGKTKRVVRSYGFMSPEYAVYVPLSTKYDVFSFGVILLEIMSGRKNLTSYGSDSI
ncbi:Serine-threonine/tyrosine-protein kinase [Theobroma cacao]|nr:Serine-threonine/tyrosine-protein kinase [Theobroma cacao]